ncbi:uncharacterized protein LOC143365386 [Halictus rubicundus]|uniref:uncharacterized protein LOC143365386 n=1 Tax=Halictus rubicundus TaxID=77578 RepID=UPI0040368712
MRDRNLVGGGPVVATTKRKKKKKRHLELGRRKRDSHPGWRCTRAGAPAKSGNRRLDVEQEEDDEEESEEGWSGSRTKDRGSTLAGELEVEGRRTARRVVSGYHHRQGRPTTSWTGRPRGFSW